MTSGPDVSWSIDASGARLKCGPLAAFACCNENPSLLVGSWNSRPIDSMSVLASAPDEQSNLQMIDRFIRHADLVVDYAETKPHRVAPQIYWRASLEPGHSAVRVEVVLSVRTELLDSAPTWSTSSCVLGADLFHAPALIKSAFDHLTGRKAFSRETGREHLFVFRQRELGLSYAEMVHPSDFVSATAAGDETRSPQVESKLFPERLEKGVIRRGRICGWFMPVENDLETAVSLARQFVDEPLPLTA